MAIRTNTAEGGSNGVVITTGPQTGGSSGDAFNTITFGANSSVSFSNTHSMHGALSYKCSAASGEKAFLNWTNWTSLKSGTTRSYFRLPTLPGFNQVLVGAYNTGGQRYFEVYWGLNNRFLVQDRNGTVYNPTFILSANTWYRVEIAFQMGITGTADGVINCAFYQGDSTTALGTFSSTTVNTGINTETFTNFSFGRNSSPAVAYDTYVDSITAQDGTTALLGPYVPPSNQLPTANAGSAQSNLEPYTTVSLAGTDSDSDGTVVSRQWRQISGTPSVTLTNAGSATATYTAPGTIAGTTLTFGYKVTDNSGGESVESTVTNDILPVTERAVVSGAEVPVKTRVVQGGGLV